MARATPDPTAQIGIYTGKGTAGSRFLSKLRILLRNRPSELGNRSAIKSWRVKADAPLGLVHNSIKGLRINFLPSGTAAFRRAFDSVDQAAADAREPDLLALYEGPMRGLEMALGMLTRHADDLDLESLLITFPQKKAVRSPRDKAR